MEWLKPIRYSRKCKWCQTVIYLPENEVVWNATNVAICPECKNSVFFTDSFGEIDKGVLVEYETTPRRAR